MIRLSLSNPKSLDDKLLHMLNIKSLRLLSYKFQWETLLKKKKEKSWKLEVYNSSESSYFPTFN